MILLYNPPSSARRKPVLPMSLLALGAVLEGEYDYRIIDGNLEQDPLAALDLVILETGADLLAVTVMPGPQLENAVPVCRVLKERHPDLIIVWGGYFPTQHYDVCLSADYLDYVVRGHGEVTFLKLLRYLYGRQPGNHAPILQVPNGNPSTPSPRGLSDIQGLAFRHPKNGAIISNPLAPIPHPRQLPPFPYHRVDVPLYVRRTFMGRRTLPHHSSYGCPFFCNFCAVVNMVNGRWLAQSGGQTADTVRYMVNTWGLDAVEFYDNNFFTHEARVADFAERIMDLNIGWWGEARIDTMLKYDDRTWSLMRDSGLRMVFLGAESGSDTTLKRMNK
ncbi:MAG TPA: cobalamin-dependent protein, partial [Candidatus Binatia bacterium]|nr:cobalamin-dependent protein [Candidatus Binatia bacterium]